MQMGHQNENVTSVEYYGFVHTLHAFLCNNIENKVEMSFIPT